MRAQRGGRAVVDGERARRGLAGVGGVHSGIDRQDLEEVLSFWGGSCV